MSSGDGREFQQDRMPPEGGSNKNGELQPDRYEAERIVRERIPSGTSDGSGRMIKFSWIVGAVFVGGAIVDGLVNHESSPPTARTEDSPQAVLNAYIQASLSANDDHAAAALTCRAPHLDSIRSLQLDLATRRQKFSPAQLQASITSYAETRTAETVTATAAVALTATVDGEAQSQHTKRYTFTLTHEDGWKVCTATSAD